MTTWIRRIVSQGKRRYQGDGYDLDLFYVTNNIIAMGFPSRSAEGVYRNHINDVESFFQTRHPGRRARVYNLCSERGYDSARFEGNTVSFAFDDHEAPPLAMMREFCEDLHAWLSAHPENIGAIHCKAGKGRTGVMISAYLVYAGYFHSAADALKYYAFRRTKDGKGVAIPSQKRYVEYFAAMCLKGRPVSDSKLVEPPSLPIASPEPSDALPSSCLSSDVPRCGAGGAGGAGGASGSAAASEAPSAATAPAAATVATDPVAGASTPPGSEPSTGSRSTAGTTSPEALTRLEAPPDELPCRPPPPLVAQAPIPRAEDLVPPSRRLWMFGVRLLAAPDTSYPASSWSMELKMKGRTISYDSFGSPSVTVTKDMVEFAFDPIDVDGDVRVAVYVTGFLGIVWERFHAWFHTAAETPPVLRFRKEELDGPHKDKKHKEFREEFSVELLLHSSPLPHHERYAEVALYEMNQLLKAGTLPALRQLDGPDVFSPTCMGSSREVTAGATLQSTDGGAPPPPSQPLGATAVAPAAPSASTAGLEATPAFKFSLRAASSSTPSAASEGPERSSILQVHRESNSLSTSTPALEAQTGVAKFSSDDPEGLEARPGGGGDYGPSHAGHLGALGTHKDSDLAPKSFRTGSEGSEMKAEATVSSQIGPSNSG